MLDLAALKQALAPIEKVGKDELTFEVEGHALTLRPLLPRNEVDVQRFAQEFLKGHTDEEGTDRYAALSYFDAFKTETLAYALVQVNNLDLREVEYVPTGEQTKAGKPVRVPKHVALRSIIRDWSRPMIDAAWQAYTDLLTAIEEKSENLVEWDPADLDTEIDRVENRLRDLKKQRETRAAGDTNLHAEQVRAINQVGQPTQPPRKAPEAPVDEAPVDEAPVDEAPVEDEWATFAEIPTAADLDDVQPEPVPPPMPPAPREPVRPPAASPPAASPPPRVTSRPADPMPDVMDSFADVDDEAVLAAEEARIIAARQKAVRDAAASGRVPPHLRGAYPTDDPAVGVGGGEFRAATPDELAARGVPPHLAQPQDPTRTRVPGTDTEVGMAKDTETLSNRGRGRARTEEPVRVNQGADPTKATNPNFRPPGGR